MAPAGGTSFLAAIRAIRGADYDVAIDLQGLIKSAIIARLSGAQAGRRLQPQIRTRTAGAVLLHRRARSRRRRHLRGGRDPSCRGHQSRPAVGAGCDRGAGRSFRLKPATRSLRGRCAERPADAMRCSIQARRGPTSAGRRRGSRLWRRHCSEPARLPFGRVVGTGRIAISRRKSSHWRAALR